MRPLADCSSSPLPLQGRVREGPRRAYTPATELLTTPPVAGVYARYIFVFPTQQNLLLGPDDRSQGDLLLVSDRYGPYEHVNGLGLDFSLF